jgi:hypothetical protein
MIPGTQLPASAISSVISQISDLDAKEDDNLRRWRWPLFRISTSSGIRILHPHQTRKARRPRPAYNVPRSCQPWAILRLVESTAWLCLAPLLASEIQLSWQISLGLCVAPLLPAIYPGRFLILKRPVQFVGTHTNSVLKEICSNWFLKKINSELIRYRFWYLLKD